MSESNPINLRIKLIFACATLLLLNNYMDPFLNGGNIECKPVNWLRAVGSLTGPFKYVQPAY